MTGVHSEQKRLLGEFDEFLVTVEGKTITSQAVLMIKDGNKKIKVPTEYCKPANIGNHIVRASTNKESNEDCNNDDKSSKEDKYEEENEYVEEEGLISQTYFVFQVLFYKKEN
ncbi:10231_t:CDS:2 [Cetraspora pellucida]|uniref:10231_t:CDS:1 n=1 Tax=Cetraspora pellucida TaxID=1433469 RepID=A0ACA9L0X4_9GLOM|nr:10231_t:CDS:2 [Cetraspora pellucida]